MSKKTLLNETQIRRFMKLADLGATHKFNSLSEGDMAYARDDDPMDDPMAGGDDLPAPEDEDLAPVGDEGEAPEVQLAPEQKEVVEKAVDAAVEAMAGELAVLGLEISSTIEGEDEPVDAPAPEDLGGEGDQPPAGDEIEMELQEDKQANKGHGPGAKAGKMDRSDIANKASGRWLKEGDDDDDDEKDPLAEEDISVVDDEEIVEQVVKRVAARLMRESRAQRSAKKLDALAEKIADKLRRK